MESNAKQKKPFKHGGMAFSGCMFVGMGVGSIFGQMSSGMFIGMGVGFIFMAIIYISQQERNA